MIPKVIHQIWINRANPELPDEFRRYRDSWLEKHPAWSYRLWNLDNLEFVPANAEQIASCKSYAQMADILRFEILLRHGGVYIDTDFECLKPIDELLEVKNFSCSENGLTVSVGIIGAVPHSPIMARCVDNIPKRLGLAPPNVETGPGYFTRILLGGGFASDLTLYPTHYFYPYGFDEQHRASEPFPDSFAVHRWAHSWAPPVSLFRRMRRRLKRALSLPAG